MLEIVRLTVGQLATNCYLVFDVDTRECIVVDPGDDAEYISDEITKHKLVPRSIYATHGHFDHVLAVRALQLAYGIPFVLHGSDVFLIERMESTAKHFLKHQEIDPPPLVDRTCSDNDVITLGKEHVSLWHAPGHTPGGICIYSASKGTVLVGDTIFARGAVGRTDQSYANRNTLGESIARILALPLETRLLPGHGEDTTVQKERIFHAQLTTQSAD